MIFVVWGECDGTGSSVSQTGLQMSTGDVPGSGTEQGGAAWDTGTVCGNERHRAAPGHVGHRGEPWELR